MHSIVLFVNFCVLTWVNFFSDTLFYLYIWHLPCKQKGASYLLLWHIYSLVERGLFLCDNYLCDKSLHLFMSLLNKQFTFIYDISQFMFTWNITPWVSGLHVISVYFQTIGCVFTLYAISPKLTVLMVTVIPAIIGVGTMMGAGLRALSKAAQDQVSVNLWFITRLK